MRDRDDTVQEGQCGIAEIVVVEITELRLLSPPFPEHRENKLTHGSQELGFTLAKQTFLERRKTCPIAQRSL